MKSFTQRQAAALIRLFLAVSFLFFLQNESKAQNDSLRQYYLQKSKSQKAGGWVMFGAGVTCFIIFGVQNANPVEVVDEGDKGGGFVAAGLLFVAGSIPLFIASGKNKRKAAEISISSTGWQRLQGNGIAMGKQPCIKLTIPL